MDDLVEEVCWRLASSASVGRIGFVGTELHILPVNIAVLWHSVVFRTAEGSRLDALGPDTPVLVEIDHLDESRRTGWSVVVRGLVERLDHSLQAVVGGTVHPWAEGDRDRWLRVRPTSITGRAISRPAHGEEGRGHP
jgi:hypothetical protein